MSEGVKWPRDLYAGTAVDYHTNRPPYPTEMIEDLVAACELGESSRVLDLACGTGQIAFGLADRVETIVAIDQEPDAVAYGAVEAVRLGVANIDWIVGRAESLPLCVGFDLVAIGNAFHRLDRTRAVACLVERIPDGGSIALLWSDTPWTGSLDWQRELNDVIDRWKARLRSSERAPESSTTPISDVSHTEVLTTAGLTFVGRREYHVEHRWTLASLAGFVYSTSFLNRSVMGGALATFEADLAESLTPFGRKGEFSQRISFAYDLARR